MPVSFSAQRLIHEVVTDITLLYNDEAAGTPAIQRLPLDVREVQIQKERTTLTTEGLTETYEKDTLDKYRVILSSQVWHKVLQQAFSSAYDATTKTAFDDGTTPGTFYGLEMVISGTDADSGADVVITRTYPKVSAKSYDSRSGSVTRKAVPTQQVELVAHKATKNLLGAALALAGMPADGVYSYEVEA